VSEPTTTPGSQTSAVKPTAPAAKPAAGEQKPDVQAPGKPAVTEPEPTEEYEIDGKVQRLTRTQARTLIQKAAAADKRLQEAAEKRKSLDELLKLADEDFEAFLAKQGKDPQKAIAALLERKAKLELMTPEQRERAKLEADLAAERAKTAKVEAERKAQQQAELDKRNEEHLAQQLIGVAEKYQLDKTPETLEGLADVAYDLLSYGVVPTVDQVAQEYIRREAEHIEKRDRKVMSKLKGEKLLKYLGDAVLKEIDAAREQARQESLKKIPAPALKPRQEKPLPPRAEGGRFISEADFDRKAGLRK
jgi:hypothetical protein